MQQRHGLTWADGHPLTMPLLHKHIIDIGPNEFYIKHIYNMISIPPSTHTHCVVLLSTSLSIPYFDYIDCNATISTEFVCRRPTHVVEDGVEKVEHCDIGQTRCNDRSCILDIHVCDGIVDCFDSSDEFYTKCLHTNFIRCDDNYVIIELDVCKQLESNPRDYVIQIHNDHLIINCTHCNLPNIFVDDTILDCPSFCDEPILKTWYNFEAYKENYDMNYNISQPCVQGELECFPGVGGCYDEHTKCAYDTDTTGMLKYCRNGGHLVSCTTHVCENSYKCPGSYCIPWRFVCNNKSDCSDNLDEVHCENFTCPGMLKCKGVSYCVHQSEVCDGIIHCPRGDDEGLCGLPECVSGCQCHGKTYSCSANKFYYWPLKKSNTLMYVDISLNYLRIFNLKGYQRLIYLNASHNIISNIFNNELPNLVLLDLSFNKISVLGKESFRNIAALQHILLKGNKIVKLQTKAFHNFPNMKHLNLSSLGIANMPASSLFNLSELQELDISWNEITSLGRFLKGTTSLKLLNLSHNPIRSISTDVFTGLINIEMLLTDSEPICCLAADIVGNCSPVVVHESSCGDILGPHSLKVITVFVSAAGFVTSTAAFGVQLLKYRSAKQNRKFIQKTDSFLICSCLVVNLLYSLYLLVLLITDLIHRQVFATIVLVWQTSILCHVMKIFVSLYMHLPTFILTCMTINRYLHIKYPLRMKHKEGKCFTSNLYLLLGGCIIICLLSVVFQVLAHVDGNNHSHISDVLCSGLYFYPNMYVNVYAQAKMILYIAYMFSAYLMICCMYIQIFYLMTSTSSKITRHLKRKPTNARQSLVKVVCLLCGNILPWLVVSIIFAIAQSGFSIDPLLFKWITVTVLAIPSCSNPVVFVIMQTKRSTVS